MYTILSDPLPRISSDNNVVARDMTFSALPSCVAVTGSFCLHNLKKQQQQQQQATVVTGMNRTIIITAMIQLCMQPTFHHHRCISQTHSTSILVVLDGPEAEGGCRVFRCNNRSTRQTTHCTKKLILVYSSNEAQCSSD